MLVPHEHRLLRRGKVRIGEGAERDPDQAGKARGLPPDVRSAVGAEMESDREAARGIARKLARRSPRHRHAFALVEDGDAERAAGAPLAFEAMTHRDLARLALAFEHERAAMAAG